MADSVTVDNSGIRKAQGIVKGAMTGSGDASNPLNQMFVQWARRYGTFTRRRFIRLSRGGGEWPPLAQSTKDARRGPGARRARKARIIRTARKKGIRLTNSQVRVKLLASTKRAKEAAHLKHYSTLIRTGKPPKPRIFSILADTGALRDALHPQAPGNLTELVAGGVRYGFAATPHKARGKGQLTYGRLAQIHHFGEGHNPARTILVEPDEQTVQGFIADAKAAAVEIGQQIGGARG